MVYSPRFKAGPTGRILLVDDERHFTQLLKLLLEKAGYEVRAENVPWRAVETAVKFQPDLIILDVHMPEMDGGTLAAKLRAQPEFKNLPLMFLTGTLTHDEVTQRDGYFGKDLFLAKPFNGQELVARVKFCLAAKTKSHVPEVRNASPLLNFPEFRRTIDELATN